jgi:hypothetical protein
MLINIYFLKNNFVENKPRAIFLGIHQNVTRYVEM